MRESRRISWVYVLFLLSGAAGLVYQVVWSRLLNEIFGVTAHAVTAVLATLLAKIALGGWLLGRIADRRPDALRFYAILELGIGVTALAGTWAMSALGPAHVWFASRLAPDSAALIVVRCALAAVVILPPTFLMGGTLPAIARVFVGGTAELGRKLSLLYGLNTFGAVLGSLGAGFVLIRAIGVHPTLWLAAAVNLGVGIASLWLARGGWGLVAAARNPPLSPAPLPAARGEGSYPGPQARGEGERQIWLLVVMGLSGFASLSLEVLWTRMLVLLLGTSTYAFVTMLSAFLVGIALGSFLARTFIDRLRQPRRTFGWIQAGIAASTLATIPLTRLMLGSAQHWMDGLELRGPSLLLGRFGVTFLIMLVPTTLIGMTFPLAARMWTRGVDALGRQLGQLYGANTLGNIAGAAVGGFVVLPLFGMQRGIALVTILNLASAAWALLPAGEARRRRGALLREAPITAGLLACAALLILWHPRPLPGTGGGAEDPVRYYREGLVSTVKVFQRASDGRQLLMAVDGITIGQSSTGVDRKQQVLAHLPFVLAPDRTIRHVLSVGLGTGILIGEVARHPGVERVECVELSPSVIEGSRHFTAYNGGVLENPAVQIINDDGVNFLRRSRERYDAIISDGKSKSGHAGNGLFYSQDYYQAARRHLAAGGVMIQWVPLEVTPRDLRTIVRTFRSVFGHTYVWLGQDSAFLVGLDGPLVLDLAHARAVLDAPETEHLRRHGWRTPSDVVTLLLADAPALDPWLAQEDTINSFEHPVLEFYPPGAVELGEEARIAYNLRALDRVAGPVLSTVTLTGGDAQELAATFKAVSGLIEGVAAQGLGEPGGMNLLRRAIAAAPEHGLVQQWGATELFEVARELDLRGDVDHAVELYREALRTWPDFVEARVNLGRALTMRGWTGEAIVEYRRALQVDPESGSAHRALAQLFQAAGETDLALAHGREALRIAPQTAEVHDGLGLSLATVGRLEEALAEFREAMRLAPSWPVPMDRAALLLAMHPGATAEQVREAVRLAAHAAKLTGWKDPMALETLAATYAAAGDFDEAVDAERRAMDVSGAGGGPVAAEMAATLGAYREHRRLSSLSADTQR